MGESLRVDADQLTGHPGSPTITVAGIEEVTHKKISVNLRRHIKHFFLTMIRK